MDCDNVGDIIPSSQTSSDAIQPINRDTVHRICSGQVVLSLAIAVKELVENAIDAGATIIDIRLKEYGSELIEVSDNGTGVKKENFQALTLKHYTSKIQQFDDLESLSTLGFRGEALSSLCALSDLTVLTKHKTADNATKIAYDRNGRITSESLGAREQGTTVTLENLFSTLPVRRKEFMKNLKREFNKMCQLLYAYCLVSKGIKFSCTNTTNKGSKNTVVSTEGLMTVKENILNVFGSKQISSLIEVEAIRPEEPLLGEYGIQLVEGESLPFSFELLISSVTHGSGRSTNDRQFFYINSRPCEPVKVAKIVNEIYKQYNNSQYPFIYLNIRSNSCLVDVNVTPDKRQIFLEKEKVLLATIKASLIEAFKAFPSTFKMQNLELTQTTTMKEFFETKEKSQKGLKRSLTDSGLKKGSILEKFQKRSKTENDKEMLQSYTEKLTVENLAGNRNKIDSSVMLDSFVRIASEISENDGNNLVLSSEDEESGKTKDLKTQDIPRKCEPQREITLHPKSEPRKNEGKEDLVKEIKTVCKNEDKSECITSTGQNVKKENTKLENISPDQSNEEKIATLDEVKINVDKPKSGKKSLQESILSEDVDISIDTTIKTRPTCKSVSLNITLDDIKESLKKRAKSKETNDVKVRFRSKINPESNKSAEEELRKQISKDDFTKMSVIGQFNLGFIITKLQNDLFIIDQHATDEKYNFEQLQANTTMENQILVNPKPLQLTAGNESLLIENEDIFKKNGFTFNIDESAPCTKKVSLTSVPLSKNIIFGKDDIDEMLFMLQDANHTMCRPSRIRAMFASRACRKSVMIGKALTKNDMRRLIDHMAEIEQPWNCPHGRPTMRHLINLDLIHKDV